MKNNITLIGMPGAGKSTVGIILAKFLSFGFIDTDVLIQTNYEKSLQQMLNERGHMALRDIEEGEILKIHPHRYIISTGGSAVYSGKVMTHLKKISHIVFLEAPFEVIKSRIHNFDSRGIAKRADQTFDDLFEERRLLYTKYQDYTFDCSLLDQEELAEEIARKIGPFLQG